MKWLSLCLALFLVGCQSKNDFLATPEGRAESSAFHEEFLGAAYVLHPQDNISVSIYKAGAAKDGIAEPSNGINPSIALTIKEDGTITLPLVGKITVGNKTLAQAEEEILQSLLQYYRNPSVSLGLSDAFVYVLGEVNKPGPVAIKSDKINLIEAIAGAGDMDVDSDKRTIRIIRDLNTKPKITTVDLRELKNYNSAQLTLNPHDIFWIPSKNVKLFNDTFTDTFPFLDMINKLLNAGVSRKTLIQ